MTDIKIELSDEGFFGLAAKGHAVGSPEACNGISAILFSLAGYMVNAEENGSCEIILNEMASGETVLSASGDDRLMAAWEMATIGLLQIEQEYKDYVHVVVDYT